MRQTRDRGYICVGGWGPHLQKLDSLGNLEWEKTYNNDTNIRSLMLNCIDLTPDGYIATGLGDGGCA